MQEIVEALYKEMKDKDKFKQSIALIQKIQKNIIDNPSEEKYRTIKQQNPKIKEHITKYFNGLQFLKIIGFQEFYDPQGKETVLKMPPAVSISYLKGQKLDSDAVINAYLL